MNNDAGNRSAQFPIRYGDILFVDGVLDPDGLNPKTRRVVILTPDEMLEAGYPIVAGAVTGTLPNPLTADYVLLPYKLTRIRQEPDIRGQVLPRRRPYFAHGW